MVYTNRCTVEDYNYTKGQGLKWVEDDAAVNPESMFAIKFNKLASWQTTIGYANGYALHFGMRGGQVIRKHSHLVKDGELVLLLQI